MDKKTKGKLEGIKRWVESRKNKAEAINEIRGYLHTLSPCNEAPVDFVKLIPLEKIEANDYNPNSVARVEMALLLKSILHDGYTQPIVTCYDASRDIYTIVDGFHRYYIMKKNESLRAEYNGLLPITVIKKDPTERMASTIRHNRARGRHSVDGMSSLVFRMLEGGMKDEEVCNELGLEAEELLRLKHITGFSKLFKDNEYRRAWKTKRQIKKQNERKSKQG